MFKPDPNEIREKYFPPVAKLFVDIETTGLEPQEGAVMLSVGAFVEYGSLREPFEVVILPTKEEWEKASPKALQVNGMTWEVLEKDGVPLKEAAARFVEFLAQHLYGKEFVHVGQNPDFDLKFLKASWYGDLKFMGYPFNRSVNIIELTKLTQQFDSTLRTKYYNSHAISKALGVAEESKVHTAIGGTMAVHRNYTALFNRFAAWVKSLHEKADKEETTELMRLPIVCPNFEDWERAAKEIGWTQPSKFHFVNRDGERYTCVWGKPPFLLKI